MFKLFMLLDEIAPGTIDIDLPGDIAYNFPVILYLLAFVLLLLVLSGVIFLIIFFSVRASKRKKAKEADANAPEQ